MRAVSSRGVAGDVVAQAVERRLVVDRAAGVGHQLGDRGRGGVLEHGPRADACGASISTSWAALPSFEPWYWRSGEGIVSASSRRVATRMFSACAPGLSSARSPTVSPSSISDG